MAGVCAPGKETCASQVFSVPDVEGSLLSRKCSMDLLAGLCGNKTGKHRGLFHKWFIIGVKMMQAQPHCKSLWQMTKTELGALCLIQVSLLPSLLPPLGRHEPARGTLSLKLNLYYSAVETAVIVVLRPPQNHYGSPLCGSVSLQEVQMERERLERR